MTTAETVQRVMGSEHADFLRKAVAIIAAQLMEAKIGAGLGKGSAERTAQRNGYRPRPWETRVGEGPRLVG